MIAMQRRILLVACILSLAALTQVHAGDAAPAAIVPLPMAGPTGPYDAKCVELLRQCARQLVPGRSTLKEIAPDYYVEPAAGKLTWNQAVAYADEHFAEDNDKRALFLWRYIGPGSPAEYLNALNLRELGFSWGTGSGRSCSFGLGVAVSKERVASQSKSKNGATTSWSIIWVEPEYYKAQLTFWLTGGDRTERLPQYSLPAKEIPTYPTIYFPMSRDVLLHVPLSDGPFTINGSRTPSYTLLPGEILASQDSGAVLLGNGSLTVENYRVGEIAYENLSFNHDGLLTHFERRFKTDNGRAEMNVQGSSGDKWKRVYYSAHVEEAASPYREMLSFTPDLVLAEREVEDKNDCRRSSRWRPTPPPRVPWPENAPFVPAFLVYYPQVLSDAQATRAGAVCWRPDGQIPADPWKQPPLADHVMPEIAGFSGGSRLEFWFRNQGEPAEARGIEVQSQDGRDSLEFGHHRTILTHPDPSRNLKNGWTCITCLGDISGRPCLEIKVTLYFDVPSEATVITLSPGSRMPGPLMPVELPCGAKVTRIFEDKDGATVVELAFNPHLPNGVRGSYTVEGMGKTGPLKPEREELKQDDWKAYAIEHYRFKNRLADMKEFKITYKPQREVEFENISLFPNRAARDASGSRHTEP